jgi:ornithine cyclodeaminase
MLKGGNEDVIMDNHLPSGRPNGERNLLVIGAEDVEWLLAGKDKEVIQIVSEAYKLHAGGESLLPHSIFLRLPQAKDARIIALPAYLNGQFNTAGLKWIASFPSNVEKGVDRASAVLILNSMATGRPKAIIEGSIISAKRTAASAALAAHELRRERYDTIGIIGCGLINLQIAQFLKGICPEIQNVIAYDLDGSRAHAYKQECERQLAGLQIQVTQQKDEVLKRSSLISFATAASQPHVDDLTLCAPGTVILHVSLRDLSPEVILSCDNVVDDVDHVCRAQTSIHLAEQRIGHRDFIRCTLGDILTQKAEAVSDRRGLTVFSPFGLGILDIALGEYVFQKAVANGRGEMIHSFLPDSWKRTPATASPTGPIPSGSQKP